MVDKADFTGEFMRGVNQASVLEGKVVLNYHDGPENEELDGLDL